MIITRGYGVGGSGSGPGIPGEDRYVLADFEVLAELDIQAAVVVETSLLSGGVIDTADIIEVDVEVQDTPRVDVEVEVLDVEIDNPDEIEV